jgi:MSHA biogenesis protein MshJ
MIKQYWENISVKVDAMSKRERVMIFAAAVVVVLTLINSLLLEPLFIGQRELRGQMVQQKVSLAELQEQIAVVVQENSPNSNSPLRIQLNRVRQELEEGNAFLKSNRDHLVQPEKMAAHLRQLLGRNSRLQLLELQTLAVAPLIKEVAEKSSDPSGIVPPPPTQTALDKQVFKHGVQLTVRGSYLDLLKYLGDLEKLPQQMYWAKAQMNVVKYPAAELTLVLYTLSLDKAWLQI